MPVPTIEWYKDRIRIIDQTELPEKLIFKELTHYEEVVEAIRALRIRGAPAIGIAAAMAVVLSIDNWNRQENDLEFHLAKALNTISATRPTAVNLFWALGRMEKIYRENINKTPFELRNILYTESQKILDEDKRVCRMLGKNGAELIKNGDSIITHCNAGGLATADFGTALAVFFTAHEDGKCFSVYADETRPLLQGARLTTWELVHAGIDVTLICDSMAGYVMRTRKIDSVMVGADRIAKNGDAANKIGTYSLSIIAKYHHIPFYVVAPLSTIDFNLNSGEKIPIEERSPIEITTINGKKIAPDGVKVFSPAFDVTPCENIEAIVTEYGIIRKPFWEGLEKIVRNQKIIET